MIQGTCHCGAAGWSFDGTPQSATACNCTLCHRYGTLWIYGFEDEQIKLSGHTSSYTRREGTLPRPLEIRFCPVCACVVAWRGLRPGPDGRRRMAVNIRLTEDEPLAHLPIEHFDGLNSFDDLPRDGRCVRDMWF